MVLTRPDCAEHAVRQYWCGSCRRRVDLWATDALPGTRFGLVVVGRTAVQHYLTGVPAAF